MDEEECTTFREYQSDLYFYAPLKKKIKEEAIKGGSLTLTLHVTNLGEVGAFDLERTNQHVKIKLPI